MIITFLPFSIFFSDLSYLMPLRQPVQVAVRHCVRGEVAELRVRLRRQRLDSVRQFVLDTVISGLLASAAMLIVPSWYLPFAPPLPIGATMAILVFSAFPNPSSRSALLFGTPAL
jgi:hypothetical protein